ncbi:hypothetical protein R83H12_02027 [Fibrobacteria bacterium R8-3-H12]
MMEDKEYFTDPRDGKVYKTVKIGEQIWMAENLNYECRGSRYKEKYGRLYTYNAAKKACPPGWHLPELDEWKKLFSFCDSNRQEIEWEINDYGFAALPESIGWWHAVSGGQYPHDYIILGKGKFMDKTYRSFRDFFPKRGYLLSVRCLKGEANNKNNKKIAIKNAKALKKDSFTDPRDGKVYKTVKIGEQIWMAENLNYECKESLCYDKDPANAEKYGRYYNWKTAMKVCPPGWHLPSTFEWLDLIKATGDDVEENILLKAKLGWESGGGGGGYDVYEFAALPGGFRAAKVIGFGGSGGSFHEVGKCGYWWSATECGANEEVDILRIGFPGVELERGKKFNYHNIRCIKDNGI